MYCKIIPLEAWYVFDIIPNHAWISEFPYTKKLRIFNILNLFCLVYIVYACVWLSIVDHVTAFLCKQVYAAASHYLLQYFRISIVGLLFVQINCCLFILCYYCFLWYLGDICDVSHSSTCIRYLIMTSDMYFNLPSLHIVKYDQLRSIIIYYCL